eukprot:TRINITY_DN23405_c0_g1_i1.p1 TRINITY_DN23405_c0_g1~~TRINITY_DN23405_c0_g1_i1.p1  ORF type:complete len:153 (-),score=41.48 TRINITY_DN23405_c0_g1_i1:133-531(-)
MCIRDRYMGKLVEKNQGRAVIGVLFPPAGSESSALPNTDDSFKRATLPAAPAAQVFFPYRGWMTFLVMPWKVYPKIDEYLKTKQPTEPTSGGLEIYHFENKNNMEIETIVPYGSTAGEYFLSTAASPALKKK